MLGEFQADLFRPELAAVGGAGRHGFAVKLPGELLDGRPHLIRILVRKDGTALTRDGDEIFFPQHLHDQLDGAEHGTLCGWAFDKHAPNRLSFLDIEVPDRWRRNAMLQPSAD